MSIHRLVMGFPEGLVVDHINHNKLDNRKINLRIVTSGENRCNSRLNKGNKYNCKGIDFVKGKYRAFINYHGRIFNLGRFEKLEDAIAARKAAEKKYHGEFAYDPEQDYINQIN